MNSKRKLAVIFTVVSVGVVLLTASFLGSTRKTPPNIFRLFEFHIPWDDSAETATSVKYWVSEWNRAIGRVQVGDNGHFYVNGRRIKFFGVNIGGGACFPRKQDASKIAGRLAKLGVNLVRLHGIDASWESINIFGGYSAETTRHLNSEALDRFDYFVAKLRDHGIYVNINLLVNRRFKTADGLPAEIENIDNKDQHALMFIDPQIRALYKEFAYQLLMHENPYTGMKYSDDPQVAFVEIVNEMGSWFWYMLTDLVSRLPDHYKAKLENLWNSYLQSRYGSIEEFTNRWGIGGARAPVLTSKMYWEAPDFVREAWLDFVYQLEVETYTELYNFLRREVGYKGIIVGSTAVFSPLNVQSRFDAIDAHAYWQHPEFPGTPWDPQNWYVLNEPMVNNPLKGTIVSLASYRVYGKPFVVSEYDHPSPNMYGPEGILMLATYAALQDWDGIIFFAYGSLDDWDSKRLRGFFDIDQNPAKMALMIPAYMVFVRGDVEPARTYIVADLPDYTERRFLREYNYADGLDVGIPAEASLIHKVAVATYVPPDEEARTPDTIALPEEVKSGVYKSDTGQVTWDTSRKDEGVLVVNTDRTLALVGFIGGKRFNFKNLILEVDNTVLNGWGIVSLVTKQNETLDDWNTMLLITTGYTTNAGIRIRDYDTKKIIAVGSTRMKALGDAKGKKITCPFQWGQIGDWGEGPTIIEGLNATVKIRTPKNIEVWALDNVGNRQIKVLVLTDGEYKVFKVTSDLEAIWYEIVSIP